MSDGLVNSSDYQNWLSNLTQRGILTQLHPEIQQFLMNPKQMSWVEKNFTNKSLAKLETELKKGQVRDLISFYDFVRFEKARLDKETLVKFSNAELSAIDKRFSHALELKDKEYRHIEDSAIDKYDNQSKIRRKEYEENYKESSTELEIRTDTKLTIFLKDFLPLLQGILHDLENTLNEQSLKKRKNLKLLMEGLNPNDLSYEKELEYLQNSIIKDLDNMSNLIDTFMPITKKLCEKIKNKIVHNL
jgi:hypothetical protein